MYWGGQSHCSTPTAGRRGEAEAAGRATSKVMPSSRARVDSEVSLDLTKTYEGCENIPTCPDRAWTQEWNSRNMQNAE